MAVANASVAGLQFHDHACWAISSSKDHRSRLVRYLSTGLRQGQQVAFLGSPAERVDAVAAGLTDVGIPVRDLTSCGQLLLASAENQYLTGGTFDPQERLDAYAAAIRAAVDEGYKGFRLAADVAWLPGRPAAQQAWPGYEMGAGLLAARLPFTAVCIYDPQQWQPRELALLHAVHSISIHDTAATLDLGLRLRGRPDGSVDLCGELDMSYAEEVQRILIDNVKRQTLAALNLAGLGFIDVAGMRAIASVCRELARIHGRATIRGASPIFRRIWQLAAFDLVEPVVMMD